MVEPCPDETEAILAQYLDADFRVYPMAEERQTIDRVEAIAEKHGVVYPPEFIAQVCGPFPGIYVEVKAEAWPRPKVYDVGPFWSFLYALHTFTPSLDAEPWMRLDDVAASFRGRTGLRAAPVLQIVGDADLYCVNERGELAQFDHETGKLEPVDMSFWELFEREIRDLRSRKDRKKASAPQR